MAKIIAIMGESGAGKTTSMRNLDPKTTLYFDCDKKGLSWKGWRNQYNGEHKNYMRTDDQNTIIKTLMLVNGATGSKDTFKDVKTIIVDTINGVMVADEMRRMKEKGYDKWQDLAYAIYTIIDFALTMRDELTVIFVAHTQTDREDSGYMFTHIKTSGKKLDKITLESKFPVVLLAKCIDGRYVFETKANNSTAKTPMGAFEDAVIDNDITLVLNALSEY